MIKVEYVDIPKGDIIFGSCDSLYFHDHVPALVSSAATAGNDVHIHVVNPVDHVFDDYAKIKPQVAINFTMSYEHTDLELVDARTYYSCNRFLVADQILDHVNKMIITDVDELIMQQVEFPDAKLGLFLRDSLPGTVGWEQIGTKVAAGIVFLTKDSIPFIKGVQQRIKHYGLRWFVDQVALWEQYINDGWDKKEGFIDYGANIMDWNFEEGSVIWTGKGDRKYHNTTYVQKKYEFARHLEL